MENTATLTENPKTISVGDWMITLLITGIPLIGLIMLFVWSFGGGTHPDKASFARAALIWFAIGIVLSILMTMILGVSLFSIFNDAAQSSGSY